MNFTLSDLGMVCALGNSPDEILTRALAGDTSGMRPAPEAVPGKNFLFGRVSAELPKIDDPADDTRSNRLALAALEQISDGVKRLLDAFPPERIGIVLGASNTYRFTGLLVFAAAAAIYWKYWRTFTPRAASRC